MFQGCYSRGMWYIDDHTAVIIGVGIGTAIILVKLLKILLLTCSNSTLLVS